jgi:hypothetical protein
MHCAAIDVNDLLALLSAYGNDCGGALPALAEPPILSTCPVRGYMAAGIPGCWHCDDLDIQTLDTAVEILDDQWMNPLNTWNHDDGYLDVPLPFTFMWYQLEESMMSIGTNGVITFGSAHLRNGGSEPIPCVNLCAGNSYGSHANHADWGIDGLIAPFWADINPGSSLDGVDENGAVFYQLWDTVLAVRWNECTY